MAQFTKVGHSVEGVASKLGSSPSLTKCPSSRSNLLSSKKKLPEATQMCEICKDSGSVLVLEAGVQHVRKCVCVTERQKRRLLERIPPRYRDARLEKLAPCKDPGQCFAPIEIQSRVIDLLRTHPDDSYSFFAPPGFGKSYMMAALFRHAVETQGAGCFLTDCSQLVRGLRDFEVYQEELPYLCVETVERAVSRGLRPRIFIDEIERLPSFTQFVSAKLHEFFDGIYKIAGPDCRGVQLVLSSNLNREEFVSMWGTAVVRRINEVCVPIDFFEALARKSG